MDRKAGHTAAPLLGSNRVPKTFAQFLENVPVDHLNRAYYNSWAMDAVLDQVEVGSIDATYGGIRWGNGSSGTAAGGVGVDGDLNTSFATGNADNAEVLITTPLFAKPAANRPITFLWEGYVSAVATSHAFMGIAAVTDPTAAGPLTASTGAIGTVDCIGFHYTQAAAPVPNLTVRDGAGTADTLAMTGITLAAATFFRYALTIENDSIWYYATTDGGSVVEGRYTPTNTTLTNLGNMGVVAAIQSHGGVVSTFVGSRAFLVQEKRHTDSFTRWLRDA